MTEQQAGFRNPTVLTSWTIRLLYAQVAVSLVAVFSGWLEYELLGDLARGAFESDELADAAAEASDARQLLVGIFQIAIFIVGGILMLMWIHRANYNARQLGAAGLRFTPGWAVGWYFIPILNLWKPYQAMKE
ncbi:MAG TPA: DUF4328 domain-containing protein, partial [Gammaproteobacteria bacterium]|nr:DUF4328 domain-containing protein [Gammaproteobacteria bacterium]